MTEIPLPYGNLPQTDFAAQYRRVFEAAECSTQTELATVLGIRQSFISDAKKRKAVPADWLITLLEKKSVNPEWIRTGLGHRLLQTPALVAADRRPVEECTTDELVTEIVRRALRGMA